MKYRHCERAGEAISVRSIGQSTNWIASLAFAMTKALHKAEPNTILNARQNQ